MGRSQPKLSTAGRAYTAMAGLASRVARSVDDRKIVNIDRPTLQDNLYCSRQQVSRQWRSTFEFQSG